MENSVKNLIKMFHRKQLNIKVALKDFQVLTEFFTSSDANIKWLFPFPSSN